MGQKLFHRACLSSEYEGPGQKYGDYGHRINTVAVEPEDPCSGVSNRLYVSIFLVSLMLLIPGMLHYIKSFNTVHLYD